MSIIERSLCESEKPLFNQIGIEYRNHLETFRGYVRAHVTRTNLAQHLAPDVRRAIDVGAGEGGDAFWLAARDVDVVMVEPSEDMRNAAAVALTKEPLEVQERVMSFPGDHRAALDSLEDVGGGFDLVMCHGVMMYQNDPRKFLGEIAELCGAGGKISLLTKNASALAFRPGLQGDFQQALEAIEADSSMGTLGIRTTAQTLQQLADWLFDLRFSLEAWYGVRIFTDHLDELSPQVDRDQALTLEEIASQRDPYRAAGRLLHVVASRID